MKIHFWNVKLEFQSFEQYNFNAQVILRVFVSFFVFPSRTFFFLFFFFFSKHMWILNKLSTGMQKKKIEILLSDEQTDARQNLFAQKKQTIFFFVEFNKIVKTHEISLIDIFSWSILEKGLSKIDLRSIIEIWNIFFFISFEYTILVISVNKPIV